jgi:hypothetical protein
VRSLVGYILSAECRWKGSRLSEREMTETLSVQSPACLPYIFLLERSCSGWCRLGCQLQLWSSKARPWGRLSGGESGGCSPSKRHMCPGVTGLLCEVAMANFCCNAPTRNRLLNIESNYKYIDSTICGQPKMV